MTSARRRADVMVTDGAEVDYQALRHPGVLCAVAVAQRFDQSEKAFWMTRDAELKGAVDRLVDLSLASGEYKRALEAASH